MGRESFFMNDRFGLEKDAERAVNGYREVPYNEFNEIVRNIKPFVPKSDKWQIDIKTSQEYRERSTRFFVTDKESVFAIDKSGEVLTIGQSIDDNREYPDLINLAKMEGANKAYCFGDKFVEFYKECGFTEDMSKGEVALEMPEDFTGNIRDHFRHFMEIRDEPNREIGERKRNIEIREKQMERAESKEVKKEKNEEIEIPEPVTYDDSPKETPQEKLDKLHKEFWSLSLDEQMGKKGEELTDKINELNATVKGKKNINRDSQDLGR